MGSQQASKRFNLPDGSRSVQSPWVWRGFLFMSFIALGLCISFAVAERWNLAVSWLVITAGWFGISMWLWRRHVRDDDLAYEASRQPNKRRGSR
jgi:hypothetical protein